MALAYVVGEVEEGAALLARAINLDPNLSPARTSRGWTHIYLGECDAAIEQFQVALRLSPLDRRVYIAQTGWLLVIFSGVAIRMPYRGQQLRRGSSQTMSVPIVS